MNVRFLLLSDVDRIKITNDKHHTKMILLSDVKVNWLVFGIACYINVVILVYDNETLILNKLL